MAARVRSTIKRRAGPSLTNADIAELLAQESREQSGILVRAYRRAARSAWLWPEEAADLLAQDRKLTELHGVGPFMSKQIGRWIEKPPAVGKIPPERRDFLARADARKILQTNPNWAKQLRGDLQMHTRYNDGSGSIREIAGAANEREYAYIAITDHSKGLKIAGGIDEARLGKQQQEIAKTNMSILRKGAKVTVLSSIEMNLNPRGRATWTRSR